LIIDRRWEQGTREEGTKEHQNLTEKTTDTGGKRAPNKSWHVVTITRETSAGTGRSRRRMQNAGGPMWDKFAQDTQDWLNGNREKEKRRQRNRRARTLNKLRTRPEKPIPNAPIQKGIVHPASWREINNKTKQKSKT